MPEVFFPANPTPENLVTAMRQLPPTAKILAKLQNLLADPNSGLDDIAEIVRLDASLTTRVIQISNSVWFGRGAPCRTIEDAVNRVGFREIYRLVAVVAAGAMVAGPLKSYGRTADIIWDESVSCAVACELIAEHLNEDTAVAYTAGLLHLIGRTPIDFYIQQKTPNRILCEEGFPREFSGEEFALLGYSQAEVAACMLEKWDFTPMVVEAIRAQYDPLEAEEPHDTMACILYGGRLLRTAFLGATDNADSALDEEVLGNVRLTRHDVMEMRSKMEDELVRVHQITKS